MQGEGHKKAWTPILKKQVMALTGLFLCLFLLVHLLGNLQLFLPEGEARQQFNAYSAILSNNPVVKLAAYATYLSVIIHSLLALRLSWDNRRAAGRARYRVAHRAEYSRRQARLMGVLGLVLLAFLWVHLKDFWFAFKFGEMSKDANGRRDLYGLVYGGFQNPALVAFYCISMLALGYHLAHGVQSAFRSLGLYPPKFFLWLRRGSVSLSWLLALGFASMPLYLYWLGRSG